MAQGLGVPFCLSKQCIALEISLGSLYLCFRPVGQPECAVPFTNEVRWKAILMLMQLVQWATASPVSGVGCKEHVNTELSELH